MPQGLQVYDESGRIQIDLTSNISQEQGSIDVNSSGSLIMPGLPPGKRRFYFVSGFGDSQEWRGKLPGVLITGDTLSWQYNFVPWGGQFAQPCRISYGYF